MSCSPPTSPVTGLLRCGLRIKITNNYRNNKKIQTRGRRKARAIEVSLRQPCAVALCRDRNGTEEGRGGNGRQGIHRKAMSLHLHIAEASVCVFPPGNNLLAAYTPQTPCGLITGLGAVCDRLYSLREILVLSRSAALSRQERYGGRARGERQAGNTSQSDVPTSAYRRGICL